MDTDNGTDDRSGVGPFVARLAAAFGLGAGLALGQVPFSYWYVALPALLAAFALITRETHWRRAAALGLLFGAGHFGVALYWIVEPFQVDAERDGWMAPFALVFIAFGLGLFWALAAGLAVRVGQGRAGRALALAATLATVEALRGHVLTGFPWALIGHLWIGWAPEQVVSVVGAYGLTLVTVLAVALAVGRPRAGLPAGMGMLAAIAGFGVWQAAQPVPDPAGPVVRLVQPDAAQHLKWDPEMARMFFERQLQFTAAPAMRRPDLIIWPETAVPFLLDDPRDGLNQVALAADGVPVVLGIQRVEGWRGFNSLAVLATTSGVPQVTGVYDKHHLVPFGEYISMGDLLADWFGIVAFAAQEGNGYSAGPGPALLDLGTLGLALPLICYEAVFPQDIRRVEARPGWLLQVTNDAWFGDLAGPFQHLSLARLRAIEFGVPLVRAANTGVSAVIDARGRVVAQLGLNVAGYLDAPLPAALAPTPYARFGEAPFLVALALLWAFVGLRRRYVH